MTPHTVSLLRLACEQGRSFASILRNHVMVERHMARRLRDLDIDALIEPTPGINDAYGHGDTLRLVIDPNGTRYERDRSDIEDLAEHFTGMQYPTWAMVIEALGAAQRELDGTAAPMGSWGDEQPKEVTA